MTNGNRSWPQWMREEIVPTVRRQRATRGRQTSLGSELGVYARRPEEDDLDMGWASYRGPRRSQDQDKNREETRVLRIVGRHLN